MPIQGKYCVRSDQNIFRYILKCGNKFPANCGGMKFRFVTDGNGNPYTMSENEYTYQTEITGKANQYVITKDMLLSESEIRKLLRTCKERAKADLEGCRTTWLTRSSLVRLVIGTGLRVSELASLKIGNLHVNDRQPYLVVTRNAGKSREVPLERDLAQALKVYIKQKKDLLNESAASDAPLFSGRNGCHICIKAIEVSWDRAVSVTGIRHVPISAARHTHAAKVFTESRDLRRVQDELGFKSIAYPALYADIRPAQNPENSYSDRCCYQYSIRQKNLEEDLRNAGLTREQADRLRVSDFVFEAYDTERDRKKKKEFAPILAEIAEFVRRHEWLGSMPLHPTQFFTARYKGILSGIVIAEMPNSFSKLLGSETKRIERTIARGASISFAPKNLGSALLMWAIHQMVQNGRYRIFAGYSDSEARELGTVYQSCSFFYAGKTSGARKRFLLPTGKWVSDRWFSTRSAYKRAAQRIGIEWNDGWTHNGSVSWDRIPDEIESRIRQEASDFMNSCPSRKVVPKGKYIFIGGRSKKERRNLI